MPIFVTPDSYTSLLIHSDKTEGSTTFVDSSRHVHSITATGNIHHDTQTLLGGGPGAFGQSSMFLDGSADYLTISDHPSFDFGTGDFTIDLWLRLADVVANKNYIARQGDSGDTLWFFRTENGPLYQFYWYDGSTQYYINAGTPEVNVWHHIAITRSGRDVKMYEDGKVIGTHTEAGNSPRSYDAGSNIYVGARYYSSTAQQFLNGWVDEVRISKGIARWNGEFTPPTKPYSVIGGEHFRETEDRITKVRRRGGGGTETDYGNYNVSGSLAESGGSYRSHTFTSSGRFKAGNVGQIDILMVAGGGSGGAGTGGGGGGGGLIFIEGFFTMGQDYIVTIGAGGTNDSTDVGTGGNDTTFSVVSDSTYTLTAKGGGYGGSSESQTGYPPQSGAQGSGGGAQSYVGGNQTGGTGAQTANSTDGFKTYIATGYSNNGGNGGDTRSGGGGGAGGVGQVGGTSGAQGKGGRGKSFTIQDGTTKWYAAGGGGGLTTSTSAMDGIGGYYTNDYGVNGVVNTGAGGGGGWSHAGSIGGDGGSGIVIIRYKI